MDIFSPPSFLLDAISADPTGRLEVVVNTPNINNFASSPYVHLVTWHWVTAVEYYGKGERSFLDLFANIAYEAFVNAAEHGNQSKSEKKIYMLMWLGEKGILFGIRDQGNFFKNVEVKEKIESRTPIPSTRPSDAHGGMGIVDFIYKADLLFVSTDESTFYMVCLKKELESAK